MDYFCYLASRQGKNPHFFFLAGFEDIKTDRDSEHEN